MRSFHKYLIIACLAACMPKEDPVEPFPRGDVMEEQLSTGAEKNDILFYDLATASLVHSARPDDWDLQLLETGVWINPFREQQFAVYSGNVLSKTDTLGLHFRTAQYDEPQWQMNFDSSYILNLASVGTGAHLGFYKLKVVKLQGKYTLFFTDLESTSFQEIEWNLTDFFNLRTAAKVDLPADYDLIMGKYVHYFQVEEIFYEVFGALTPDCSVVQLGLDFQNITSAVADTVSWQPTKMDAIGYDWKSYNLQKGAYEIDETANYLIKTKRGFIYKFRFTSFYDGGGQSGHPSFEFQLL